MRFVIPSIILLLTLLALIKIICCWKKWNISIADRFFLFIAFAFMIIPASYIHNKTVNKWENRNFYKAPSLITDKGINSTFGKEFENYFGDHVVGRKDLMKVHTFMNFINKKQKNEKVAFGSDNWLFYKYDNSIANYKNEALFTNEELALILKNLNYIRSFNPNFYLFIAPDKNKIYGEFFPKDIVKTNPDSKSRANQLIHYIKQNSNIPVIYPYNELHQAKQNNELLYYKHGTHWNFMGAEVGFIELLKEMKKNNPQLCYKKAKKYIDDESRDIDLAESVPYFKNIDKTIYKKPQSYNNCGKKSPQSIFVFNDSFLGSMSPYFKNVFSKVDSTPYKKFDFQEIEKIKNYDVVVFEMVERYIYQLKFEEGLN